MPESFWKGTFLPIQKHMTSVTFVPICDMSNEDWGVLDYDELRPAPANELADAIVGGSLVGFYMVDFDLHKANRPHGGKPKYFYPAKTGLGFDKEYGETNFGDTPENDTDIEPTRPKQRMDDLMFWLRAYMTAETAKVIMEKLLAEPEIRQRICGDTEESYEEFANSYELLEIRHQMLLMAIALFAADPQKARAILRAVDILDDEVYAALNDEEPTD